MKEIIDNLKGNEIIYEKSVELLKNYIAKKYPSGPDEIRARVFADAIHKILDDHISEFQKEEQKEIKKTILSRAVEAHSLEINAYDILKASIYIGIDEDIYAKDLIKWLNNHQELPVKAEMIHDITVTVRKDIEIEYGQEYEPMDMLFEESKLASEKEEPRIESPVKDELMVQLEEAFAKAEKNVMEGDYGYATSYEPFAVEKKQSFENIGSDQPMEALPAKEEPVEVKPIVKQSVKAKEVEAKPVIEEPVKAKEVEAKPVVEEPVKAKAVEAKQVVEEPVKAKAVEAKSVVEEPIENNEVEAKPVVEEPIEEAYVPKKRKENKPISIYNLADAIYEEALSQDPSIAVNNMKVKKKTEASELLRRVNEGGWREDLWVDRTLKNDEQRARADILDNAKSSYEVEYTTISLKDAINEWLGSGQYKSDLLKIIPFAVGFVVIVIVLYYVVNGFSWNGGNVEDQLPPKVEGLMNESQGNIVNMALVNQSETSSPRMDGSELDESIRYKEINQEALKEWLSNKNSLLSKDEYFDVIMDVSKDYSVNPLLMFAITGQEQNYVQRDHENANEIINNPFNVYHSWKEFNTTLEESTQIAAKTIHTLSQGKPEYMDPIEWINNNEYLDRCYAQDQGWHKGVSYILNELEEVAGTVQ